MAYYNNTGSYGPVDLPILENALNQAWDVAQSRNYERDPTKAAEIYSSLALTIMQLASSGETGLQTLVGRALMFLPAKA